MTIKLSVMKKGFVFTVHSVAGLLSGLFILLMSLSGAVLVFHDELDQLQYPAIVNDGNKIVLSVDSFYHLVQKQYPSAQISNASIAKNNSEPFIFTLYDSSYENGMEAMQVFIHPQTGTVLKTRGNGKDMRKNFMSWLSVFHNSLHLKKTGEWLLGFFSIIFLVSLITGFILYGKKIAAVLLFKRNVFSKANLHQLIGVYALLFNLMIGITGYWMQRYVFKKSFYAADTYKPVLKTSPAMTFNFDGAYKNVQKQFPGFTGYIIYFAQSTKGKTAIYGSNKSNSFIHSKKYADVVMLDSAGHIAKTAFVNEINASSRYDIINAQVHYGQYGGLPVKIIYSLLGLTSGLLSVTGFLLWYRRRSSIRLY